MPISAIKSASRRARRVLVVEDDAVSRTYLRIALEKWGYQVLPVHNVKIAQWEFNIRGREHFHCVLSDYWLPDQTGLDLIRWLKEEDSSIATIMLTADPERKLITESLRLGVIDFLEKPIDLARLQTAVEKAVTQTERLRHMVQSESAMEGLGRAQRWMVQAVDEQMINLFFHPKLDAGGDFFAHFQVDKDTSCCLLTDVSGHDAQAAYISAYFHGIFKGMTLRDAPMTTVFSYFNDFLVNEWNDNKKLNAAHINSTSLAAAAVLIDSRQRTASLLNCGAPPPVQVIPNGRAQFMGELGGPPLGWFADTEIQAAIYSITGGGVVYMWTDGLSDLAESQRVHPLCLAFALQQVDAKTSSHSSLKHADDDILFAAVHLPDTDPEIFQLRPLIVEHYPGSQASEIDMMADGWRRNLKLALPHLSDNVEHDILLAAREAVLNGMQHGCQASPAKSVRFQISYHSKKNFIRIWIDDPGKGHTFDLTTKANSLSSELTDAHHGLIFITNLAQNVRFERNGATIILDFQL